MYKINPLIDVPIYTQLVDMIKTDIYNGTLPFGTKLPTVRDLSEECGIAPGTVMRVYEQLEQMGLAEKKQGKGTFVSYREVDEISRKDKAMAAIDAMLDTMDELNFSESERNIFLNLKLRQRAIGTQGVQIVVIECNNEILFQISEQLRGIGDVTVYSYQLDDIRAYPYQLPEDMDLLVIPASHAEELIQLIPNRGKMVKVALSLTTKTLKQIARIPDGCRVGILCQTIRFGELLVKACKEYADHVIIGEPETFAESSCLDFSDAKPRQNMDKASRPDALDPVPGHRYRSARGPASDVLLIPENYERFCDISVAEKIRLFAQKHTVIQCEYQIDAGSLIYLSDRIKNAKNR